MGVTPDDRYLLELQQVTFQPVFILGVHRSGTSILYKMLTATGSFNPVTAYHIINYPELLRNHQQHLEEHARQQLTESLKAQGVQNRKIDALEVSADLAEEYGFLLNRRTMAMYLSPRNISLFAEMSKKIQYIAGNTKPLLLKNPYDFPNFLYIKQVFPNAKFIFIHRHPVRTISSTLKAFQVIFRTYHPYMAYLWKNYERLYTNPFVIQSFRMMFSYIPEFGVMYITRTTAKATKYYLNHIRELASGDYVAITYEEFCRQPQKTIEDIMQRLSLDMDIPLDAVALMSPRKANVDGTVQKMQPFIYRCMKKYCDVFGYKMDGNDGLSLHSL
jgi:hypothetical protein